MDYTVLTPQQLAAHLRSLRRAKKLSQAELGRRIGLSQGRVGKIERDPQTVSVGQVMRILALLGARFVLRTHDGKAPSMPRPPSETADW
jgi:HTH-type transcriptional regulator / antitoxin HipB